MITEIKIEDIKPVGNFEGALQAFRDKADMAIAQCKADCKYNSSLANLVTSILVDFGMIDVLEEGITENDAWDINECMICLLYTHLLIIDINQTAHTYLNGITEWDSRAKQLQESIDAKPDIYKGIKIIE